MSKLFPILQQFNIDPNIFYQLLKKIDASYYQKYSIKKKSGGLRIIEKPIDKDLIDIQRKIKLFLESEYSKYKPNQVHGFVKNRSIKTNAEIHASSNHKYILKIDIKDFFGSINYQRIFGMLNKTFPNLDHGDINALTLFCTCNKHLPQGASTSPIVSNMVCKRMDKDLFRFAKAANSIYTRYADDITFSIPTLDNLYQFLDNTGLKKPYKLSSTLLSIFSLNGFVVNQNKIKLLKENTPQYICGISIKHKNTESSQLSIRRKILRDIAHSVYEAEQGRMKVGQSLVGKISFLRYINGENNTHSINYSIRVNNLIEPPFPQADFEKDKNYTYAKSKYLVYIESIDDCHFGTGFFSNGYLITSRHVVEEHGNYPQIIRIAYYDKGIKNRAVKKAICVKNIFVHGEMAFITFDGIEKYAYKYLKISGKIEPEEGDPVLCMGCGNYGSRSFSKIANESYILDTKDQLYGDVYKVEDSKIYKGMSGGPLINLKTFKVIGVNYAGQQPGANEEDYPRNVCSKITKEVFKYLTKVY